MRQEFANRFKQGIKLDRVSDGTCNESLPEKPFAFE